MNIHELDNAIANIMLDYKTGLISSSQALRELKQAFEYHDPLRELAKNITHWKKTTLTAEDLTNIGEAINIIPKTNDS